MTASMRQHACLETLQMDDERSSAHLVPALGVLQCHSLHQQEGERRASPALQRHIIIL